MQQEKFDCIIIDLGLPDMKRFRAAGKDQGRGGLNRIPIIVYTAKDLNKRRPPGSTGWLTPSY